MEKPAKQITGRQVLVTICLAFLVIISVNLTLAFQAIATFPGLETRNSYVTSQAFDKDRTAQKALGWQVSAVATRQELRITFTKDGTVVRPVIETAVVGRATHVGDDQTPKFSFDGAGFAAPVDLKPGNWNLRITARAADGTIFRQRIVIKVAT